MGAMVKRDVPVEEATTNKLSVEPATPCRVKRFCGVVVLIPTLPKAVTLSIELVEEEETLKGSKVPAPLMLKETVAEVALTPATVPLSIKVPKVKPVEEAQVVT